MDHTFNLKGASLKLLAERAVYWKERKSLLVADVHLGKAGHFRKHGVPIPRTIHDSDLGRLSFLLGRYEIERVVFMGDLFHSDFNNEWHQLQDWVSRYPSIQFVLVKGNHDILDESTYPDSNLEVVERLEEEPFLLTHDRELHPALYNLYGHIHPGVRLRGLAKQGVKIPCFYFTRDHGILPAFGNFTGLYAIRTKRDDSVFGVVEGQVIDLNPK